MIIRHRSSWRRIAVAGLACVLPALGQSTYGEIRGTVSTAGRQAVKGATVSARKNGTGEIRAAATDVFGNYAIPNLVPEAYEVSIEFKGMRKVVVQNVLLRARDIARVDARLEEESAGATEQTREARQVIATDTAAVTDSKNFDDLVNLPVNFRAGSTNTVYSVLSLTPGVQSDSIGLSLGGGVPFAVNATLDGISMNDVRRNGIPPELFPSADMIGEIKVSMAGNNAEFAQAGDVTTTSRSGANFYQGSLYWFTQNGHLDARDFFSTRQGAPFKVSNDLGANVGGPIVKGKTFFFASWESLRYRAEKGINIIVPPEAFRAGDLSSVSGKVKDPLSGSPFAGNIIPANRISPVSSALLEALYPHQNQAGTGIASPNYRLQAPARNQNDAWDGRVDHVLTARQSLFARFSYKDVTAVSPLALTPLGNDRLPENDRSLTAAHNTVLRSNLMNEFRSGYVTRLKGSDFGPNGASFDGPGLMRAAGVTGLRSDPPKVASVPDITINGFAGTGHARGFEQYSRNLELTDTLSWSRGRHTVKAGADVRFLTMRENVTFFNGDDLGEYKFSGTFSGNAMADYLLGYAQRTRVANTGPDIDGHSVHHGYFVQDDFRASSRLTLNAGVRYEYHAPFFDNTLQMANFDRNYPGGRVVVPNAQSQSLTAPGFRAAIGKTPIVTAAEAGLPQALRFSDKNNFAPRIGFAYRLGDGKTVVRGGYGIYTVTVMGGVFYSLIGIHTSDTRTFNGAMVNGAPNLQFPSPFLSGLGTIGSADFRRGNQFHAPDPYTQQWNFTVERDLGWNSGMRLSYTGSHTIKLFNSPDLNQVRPNTTGYAAAKALRPYPNWGIVYSRDAGASAKYNALTTEVHKRFSHGLSFQTSWDWAKNLSNTTGSAGGAFPDERGLPPTDRFNLGLDYGNTPSTRRHRLLSSFTYMLPVDIGSGSAAARVARMALANWQLSGIVLWQTGPYLTPVTGGLTDPSGTNLDSRTPDRPDYVGTAYGNIGEGRTVSRWFDRSAFAIPAGNIGRFGSVGPGQLVGPGTQVVSARLLKRFSLRERVMWQFEATFTNLLNHANFAAPALDVSSSSFGRITSTQAAEGAGSRIGQLGLRVSF